MYYTPGDDTVVGFHISVMADRVFMERSGKFLRNAGFFGDIE